MFRGQRLMCAPPFRRQIVLGRYTFRFYYHLPRSHATRK